MGESEFVFMQGIRSQAGKFNKQHGGMELTGGRCLLLLERRDAIVRLMKNTYPSDEDKRNDVVEAVEGFWLKAAEHLYNLGMLMKSQKKMTATILKDFEHHMVQFLIIWLKYANEFKGNPIFWKLHNLFCSIKDFANSYEMIGRVSAEGFENKHVFMRIQKETMRSVISTKHRVENISFRQQISVLHPGVVKKNIIIQKATQQRKKRGSHKNKGQRKRQGENISEIVDEVIDENQEDVPDGFFRTESDGLLPNEVSDMYNYLLRAMTPSNFYDPFDKDPELGSKEKGDARFL